MNNTERLDILTAVLMCGEDTDCERCPLQMEDDCKSNYFEGTLYEEAMKVLWELREQEEQS